jgi:F0F1-type ATP synthase epsilon subunit
MQYIQIDLTIVKPEGESFNGKCTSVILPGKEGMIEIMYGHEPMLVELTEGIISIKSKETQNISIKKSSKAVAVVENTEVKILLLD